MDDRAFLQGVLPWPQTPDDGYITVHSHLPDQPFVGRSCRTLDEFIAIVESFKRLKTNIYYCLSRQTVPGGKRSRETANAIKAIWLDADVGEKKGYKTLEEAAAAVKRFIVAAGLPPPSWVLVSGSGLHVYWESDRILTVEEWQPYADGLKTVALMFKLKFDSQCTIDAARVLRPPLGTLNYKTDPPGRVRLLDIGTGKGYDFAAVFAHIKDVAPIASPKEPIGQLADAFKDDKTTESLADGIEPPPFNLNAMFTEGGCGWLREALETGGKAYDQPQWNLTTLCATFMTGGNELAHAMAMGHPEYSYESTEKLWNRKSKERNKRDIGWPSCRAIEAAGSTHCRTCKHRILDQSPFNLGTTSTPDDDPETTELRLPEGFIARDGYIYGEYTWTKGKTTYKKYFKMFNSVISEPVAQKSGTEHGLAFKVKTDMGSIEQCYLPVSCFYNEKLRNALSKQCVFFIPGEAEGKLMNRFFQSWLSKLHQEQKARAINSLGWTWEDDKASGFVYGGQVYNRDGTTVPSGIVNDNLQRWYLPTGNREPVLRAAKLLTDQQRPELDVLLSVPFASPLMMFTGELRGVLLSVWGEPGTAKSAAQKTAAAVWGNPTQTRETLTSTEKSVLGRLGRIKNLPAYWDDIQDEEKQRHLAVTGFVCCQGAEGSRLNNDATMKERFDWQSILVACSNMSFVDYVYRKQPSTGAMVRRVFEIPYNNDGRQTGMIDELKALRTFGELERNYGTLGMDYAKLLATELDEIEKTTCAILSLFKEDVRGTAAESYWWGLCGCLIAGAKFARRVGFEINYERMYQFLLRAYHKNRELKTYEATESGTQKHTAIALASLLKHFVGAGHTVYTDKTWQKTGLHLVTVLAHPLQGRELYAQIVRDERLIRLSKRAIRVFLDEQNIQPRGVIEGMMDFYSATEIEASLASGTPYVCAQEYIIEIPVPPGSPLEEVLHAHGREESGPKLRLV